jgi:hypothetical protein
MKRMKKILLFSIGGVSVLCLGAALISALSNLSLPDGPKVTDRLDPLDKARLAEAFQLKANLGDTVWSGWGQANFPILIWNRDYSFLVRFPGNPPGWEVVPGDSFQDQVYYRQRSDDTQNFAVQVGEVWVASMGTKWETDAFLMETIGGLLPPGIRSVFPYRLIIQPSEVQISGVLHETFHVYQAQAAPTRLLEAEQAHSFGDSYWGIDEVMHDAWADEIDLLALALDAADEEEVQELVRCFLALRQERRSAFDMDESLINYERQLEWEEGLAKYIELTIWQAAYEAKDYMPVIGMDNDPDFKYYKGFPGRWRQEIDQMKRQAGQDGESRFYYTGMAQAMLLDKLLSGWKLLVWRQGVWLESLLTQVVQ